MRLLMRPLTGILLAVMAVISLWTVIGLPSVAHRWFGSGNLVWFLPVPILVVACVWGIFSTTRRAHHHATPFLLSLALVFLGYTGLVISIWPNIVPPSLTIWQASSSHSSQLFALVGTVIVLPIILVYNAMQYRVFRGKVREGDPGYHH
jgi:cytochrome d ubiquinol oxidase subunit II